LLQVRFTSTSISAADSSPNSNEFNDTSPMALYGHGGDEKNHAPSRETVTINTLRTMFQQKSPITMVGFAVSIQLSYL
jgi:hypothetical protein